VSDDPASDPNCIFCKIVSGEIPATFVYRDADVIVIEDVNSVAPQHRLVITTRHWTNAAEFAGFADPAVVARFFSTGAQLGREQREQGNRLVINSGAEGGQTVDHLHMHVISGRQMSWPPG
jgi:histidine triad (HIT) family protein